MEVILAPDVHSRLDRMAQQQGRDSAQLVAEAVDRMVSHDDWFLAEVDKGIAAADRGELIDHEEVGNFIRQRYPA